MKKVLLIILVLVVGYIVILVAPVVLFLFHISSLEFQEDGLQEQLRMLSTLSIFEEPDKYRFPPGEQNITVTVTNEHVNTMLYHALTEKQNPFMTINQVNTTISPEMIHLGISSDYGFFSYQPYKTTLFSEWMVRVVPNASDSGKTHIVAIKPITMHTNHLYTVNLAGIWKYVAKTGSSNGWLALPSTSQLQIRALTLKDQKASIHVN